MMMTYNYQYIEELLLRLVGLLVFVFTDSERKEIQDFIDVGEYGLALETFADIVNEENKQIPRESLELVYRLVKIMELEKSMFESRLSGHVGDR